MGLGIGCLRGVCFMIWRHLWGRLGDVWIPIRRYWRHQRRRIVRQSVVTSWLSRLRTGSRHSPCTCSHVFSG